MRKLKPFFFILCTLMTAYETLNVMRYGKLMVLMFHANVNLDWGRSI